MIWYISDIKLLSYRDNIIINQIISISENGMRLERYHIRIMCYMWCTCYAIYIYNWCDINDVITVMILYDMIVMIAVMIWYDSNGIWYDIWYDMIWCDMIWPRVIWYQIDFIWYQADKIPVTTWPGMMSEWYTTSDINTFRKYYEIRYNSIIWHLHHIPKCIISNLIRIINWHTWSVYFHLILDNVKPLL